MPHQKRKLPEERTGLTHRFLIGEHKGYVTVNMYEDGSAGEIFVKMDRQGSQVSGFVDAWAISISMLLQRGVSLAEICRKFKGTRFEPDGMTNNPNIRIALSPIDYIARWLEGRFVISEQLELLAAAPEATPEPEPASEEAPVPEEVADDDSDDSDPCGQCGKRGLSLRLWLGVRKCKRCCLGLAPLPEDKVAP